MPTFKLIAFFLVPIAVSVALFSPRTNDTVKALALTSVIANTVFQSIQIFIEED